MQIREAPTQTPFGAKEVKLLCPHCQQAVYVPLPWNVTAELRQRMISEAITEHRGLCSAAPPEVMRVYEVSYPRA